MAPTVGGDLSVFAGVELRLADETFDEHWSVDLGGRRRPLYHALRFNTLTMFEKSSVHSGVDGGIAGMLQRASVASGPRSAGFLAISIHVDEKSSGVIR